MREMDSVTLAVIAQSSKAPLAELIYQLIAAPNAHALRTCGACKTDRLGERQCCGASAACAYSDTNLLTYDKRMMELARALAAYYMAHEAEESAKQLELPI